MPLSLQHFESNPDLYIGPSIASLFIEAIETGILINQSFTFWERVDRERAIVRLLVAWVTCMAFVQTGFSFYSVWRTFVLNFGNWLLAEDFSWADRIQSTMTVSMASPVKALLIWRCWTLIHKNWFILVSLSLFLVTATISSILVTVETVGFRFILITDPTVAPPKIPPDPRFILALVSSAVLDVAVTGILLTFLSRSKQHVLTSRVRRILKRLTILIWEAALPPCVCAIMTTITYLALVNNNYWDLTFQAILGKLYVISLFVTLNGRSELQDHVPGLSTIHVSNLAWVSSGPVRVDISANPESEASQSGSLADPEAVSGSLRGLNTFNSKCG
ncbi:hypothetical protein CERSUDRAFT_86389 [Gelatoporia subvermispora B]|uniref:DUF6534 domain-containing protein n=1 Tax=Ceriporiopsis subvermispora (strain B) TaxID=914234 RepID=M2QBA2_CERS8|nr:hypothetical protein CERSUDRAFT_86389 [Gelatoporia subvermispora B]